MIEILRMRSAGALLLAPLLLGTIACSSDDDPPAEVDMGPPVDFIIDGGGDVPPPAPWTAVVIEDLTRPGEGVPLDAVEVCDPVGANCVALDEVTSSDEAADFAGATDGPNSQDDTCDEGTLTWLRDGNTATFSTSDGELRSTFKLNVWTAPSDCPLVAVGARSFSITIVSEDATEELEECDGTCTVTIP